jgi:uncharacterized protein (DUF433 family)
MKGKPVITDIRITGELISEKLATGETIPQIVDAHPRLTPEAIQAALAFAAQALRAEVQYPTAEEAALCRPRSSLSSVRMNRTFRATH